MSQDIEDTPNLHQVRGVSFSGRVLPGGLVVTDANRAAVTSRAVPGHLPCVVSL
jgi:hypothetical protein